MYCDAAESVADYINEAMGMDGSFSTPFPKWSGLVCENSLRIFYFILYITHWNKNDLFYFDYLLCLVSSLPNRPAVAHTTTCISTPFSMSSIGRIHFDPTYFSLYTTYERCYLSHAATGEHF